MTFGDQVDQKEAKKMVDRALEAGINFFDTADQYSSGTSEEFLGNALEGKRDEVVVTTKVYNPMGTGPNDRGLSRKHIFDAIEDSLRRLNMDYVDLYQLHQPDYSTPIEESLSAMDKLIGDGKARYIGVSNYAAWQICEALNIQNRRNFDSLVSMQAMYNLLARGIEQELVPFIRKSGLGLMVYNPLSGGLLTGKHTKGEKPKKGTRFDLEEMYRDRYWHPLLFEAADQLSQVAEKAGLTMIELSLRWLLAQPEVTTVILGASSVDQLDENIKACEGGLSDETLEACDEVWEDLRGPIPEYNR